MSDNRPDLDKARRALDLGPLIEAKVREAQEIIGDAVEGAIVDRLLALGWKRPDGDTSGGEVAAFLSFPADVRKSMLALGVAIVESEAKRGK